MDATANSEVWSFLYQIIVLLAGALLLGYLFELMRMSAILGYLLAGMLLGPHVSDVIHADSGVPMIAELGVALLLFTIGLEFSLKRLLQLGKIAILGGSLQVIITGTVAALLAFCFPISGTAAVAVGAAIALSSTACVLRTLIDRAEMDSIHGRTALGILLLQDIAVVPLLLLVSSLGQAGGGIALFWGITKSFALIAIFIVVAHFIANRVITRLLRGLSSARDRELLILLATLLAVGSAYAAHALHLSPALGAFVAGIVLGECAFATQIRADISALRALFITLFFTTVGMLGDPVWLMQHLPLVIAVLAAVIAIKATILASIARLLGQPLRYAIAAGIGLAQIGEFGVVIAETAYAGGSLSQDTFRLLISVTLLSLFATPFLISRALPIGTWLEKKSPFGKKSATSDDTSAPDSTPAVTDHIIIIGYGPAGREIGKFIVAENLPAIVLDMRPINVDLATRQGLTAAFGDATKPDILLHHRIHRARAIIITIPDHRTAVQLVSTIRALAPNTPIIVRARYNHLAGELDTAGATTVINEELRTGEGLVQALREIM